MKQVAIAALVLLAACNESASPSPGAIDAALDPDPDGSVVVVADATIADATPAPPDGAVVALPDASAGAVGWVAQDSGVQAGLLDVWFHDAANGWVVGDSGTLLRTSDGGATWVLQDVGITGDHLVDIEFADADHGWILVYPGGGMLITSDGGDTWTAQPGPPARSMSFVSPTRGWLAARTVFRSTDGGATWDEQLGPGIAENWRHAIDFVDDDHGWVLGGASGMQTIDHTSDGGATWQLQWSGGSSTTSLQQVFGVTTQVAWAVGGDSQYLLGERKMVTRDGGASWQRAPDSSNGTALDGIHFVDVSRGWAVGFAGSIIATVDGGATWTVQVAAGYHEDEDSGHPVAEKPRLHGVFFLDADRGWAVGDEGTILETGNGGAP